ncbi:MAG: HAD family hydrolase [Candidatus Limnocylindrales bacterium]
MLTVEIPDFGRLLLSDAVLDFNGTLACDGALVPGAADRLRLLADQVTLHVVTADTFGTARQALGTLPVTLTVLHAGHQAEAKAAYVRQLGAAAVVAIGNGRNDRLMLREAALSIVVVQAEGAAREAIEAAQLVCPDINLALDLLLDPTRLVATLRG